MRIDDCSSRSFRDRLCRGARFFFSILALVLCGAIGFFVWTSQPSIPETDPPSVSFFSPALVDSGSRLASAGFCATCHSVPGGEPYGGGYAMKTGFGTIYSTNISPDRETGIGSWSEMAFRRAMREGVARDGSQLFPAFPFDHFTKLSDDDIHALYAFVMTRPAVRAPAHPNEMPFPLGIRALQAGWKLLFFRSGRFSDVPGRTRGWNRGAYLAESLSHCSACHTPRGLLGEEDTQRRYRGAAVDGWFAPALTEENPSPVAWGSDELRDYLMTGVSLYHGSAAGPMAPVTEALGGLQVEDQTALVTYVESLGSGDSRTGQTSGAVERALAIDAGESGASRDEGGRIYTVACSSCHFNGSTGMNRQRPDLALNSAVHIDDPSNLIRVILYGMTAKEGTPGIVMPGFAHGLTDQEVASVSAYLRASRTDKEPWPGLKSEVAAIRASGSGASP